MGSHDQYFFRFPERILAGTIAAPRFMLENRSLIESHLNSLVLQLADFKFYSKPRDFLGLGPENVGEGMRIDTSYAADISAHVLAAKAQIIASALAAFGPQLAALSIERADLERHVDQFVDRLDQAFESFREDRQTSVIVLSGNGRAFSAGADVTEMRKRPRFVPFVSEVCTIVIRSNPSAPTVNGASGISTS